MFATIEKLEERREMVEEAAKATRHCGLCKRMRRNMQSVRYKSRPAALEKGGDCFLCPRADLNI